MKLAIITILLLWSATAGAQDCLVYADHQPHAIEPLGTVVIPDFALGITTTPPFGSNPPLAVVAADDAGVVLVDLTDVSAPLRLGRVSTFGDALDIAAEGAFAYVADNAAGVHVIGIEDVHAPTLLASIATPELARNVALDHPRLYVACRDSGLQVIDVEQPTRPVIRAFLPLPGGAEDIALSGSTAFVASGGQGLHVIDITDPDQPSVMGALSLEDPDGFGYITTICVRGPWVFAAALEYIFCIDATDPTQPEQVAVLTLEPFVRQLTVVNDHLYVAGDDPGLAIVDIFDPANPRVLGRYVEESPVWGVATTDSCLYLVDGVGLASLPLQCETLQVFPGDTDHDGHVDLGDALALVANLGATGRARDDDGTAWGSQPVMPWDTPAATHADANGDGLVDRRDLSPIVAHWGRTHVYGSPELVIDPDDQAFLSAHRDSLIAMHDGLADPDAGPATVELREALGELLGIEPLPSAGIIVSQNRPNPFNPRTTIDFVLARDETVTIEIIDPAGHKLRTVLDQQAHAAGRHSLEFAVEGLGSGVYFYRVSTPSEVVVRKLTVLK